ncbi:MAG TPA: hypothetical protein VHA30_00595, partial [Patescibacteria group bacterium]|nr:hypothetical protein [Patescibacteria group bacterium]
MKNLIKTLILSLILVTGLSLSPQALAATPVLSASYQSSGNLQVNISNANSYSQVNLYSRQTSTLWTVVNNLGQTDGSGYFTQVISMPGDGSSNPIQLYAMVGGLQSSTVSVYPGNYTGCSYGNCGGNLSLSQSSVNLNQGQSTTVTAYNYYSGLYVSSNSNSSVASASVSGNTVTVYGLNSGSTSITICANSSSYACATLYVTVGGNNNCYYGNCGVGNLYLSQTSLSLSAGQSATVTISGSGYYGNSYYVSSNSNSSVASASISGSTINVYALAAGS